MSIRAIIINLPGKKDGKDNLITENSGPPRDLSTKNNRPSLEKQSGYGEILSIIETSRG
jgi:hypothetical protein